MAAVNTNPPILTEQQIKRFWSKVDKTPGQGPKGKCWGWLKGTVGDYGSFGTFTGGKKRNYYAHRLSFFLVTGYWPTVNVCHECDWPLCCNPAHLFAGTAMDNSRDKVAKCRQARGESQWLSKVTAVQVLEIRQLVAGGAKQNAVASQFGLSPGNVNVIVKKKRTWLHI